MIKAAFEQASDRVLYEQMAQNDCMRYTRENMQYEKKIQAQKDLIQQLTQKQV